MGGLDVPPGTTVANGPRPFNGNPISTQAKDMKGRGSTAPVRALYAVLQHTLDAALKSLGLVDAVTAHSAYALGWDTSNLFDGWSSTRRPLANVSLQTHPVGLCRGLNKSFYVINRY